MSGQTGITAAIKRRASNINVNVNSKQNEQNFIPKKCSDVQNCKINENTNVNANVKKINNPSINDVLGFHEVRINNIDKGLESLNDQQHILDENMSLLLETNENQLIQIKTDISNLKIKKSHIDSVESKESPEDVAYFKEKVLLLESQILELKTLVLKVQNQVMIKTLDIK